MSDPNAWQPLAFEEQVAQNGLPIPGSVQSFIGPHWGNVTPFALPPSPDGIPIDPGPPPRFGDPTTDEDFKQAALTVLRYSSELDATDGEQIDAGPGALRRQPARDQRWRRLRREPGDRRAVRTQRHAAR